MKLVLDANIVVALSIPLPYSSQATGKMLAWQEAETELFAPSLLEYELVAALRKAIVAEVITTDEASQAIEDFGALGIQMVAPTRHLHHHVLQWAERLQQKTAYDAHYLALAEQLRADLWTADQRLANGARQAGVSWVHWIGDEC
jgi:predicted nucleic acid-binding protein